MNVALVLAGGGAKGAFQAGAEKVLREEGGYNWTSIAGVSVGALNGVMLSMQKFAELEKLWSEVRAEDVFIRRGLLGIAVRILFGARGIYDHSPLFDLIEREFEAERLQGQFSIGSVSLRTGKYLASTEQDAERDPETFKRSLFASATIPVMFPPVDVSKQEPDMVDGGLRNISPLQDVLKSDPDEVVIILTEPREKQPVEEPLKSIVRVAERSLSVVLDEILRSDLQEFLRINALVAQAEEQGFALRKPNGRLYKRYRSTVVEPLDTLGSALDFSRTSLDEWWVKGQARAREVLGSAYTAETACRT